MSNSCQAPLESTTCRRGWPKLIAAMIESRFLNMLSLRYVVPLISLAWVLGPFAGCSIDSSVRPLQTESLLNQLPPAFWVSSNPIIDVPKVELQREQTPARVSERQQNLHDSHDENGKEAADHDGKIASIRMLEKQPGSVSAGSSKHHLPNANHVAGERSHQISTRFLDPELTADPPQAEPAPPEVVETPTTTFFPAGRSTLEMVAEPIQDNPIPDDNVEELKGTSPEAQMDTQSHNELKLAETTPADKDQPAETSGHTAHPSDAKYRLHGQAAWRPLAVPDNPPQADDSGPPPFTLNIVETPRQNDTAPDNSEEIEGNTLTIRSNPTSSENIATQTPKVQIASPLEPNSSPPYRLVIVHPENRPDETTRMNTDNGNGSDESLKASTNTHFTTAEGATTSSGDQSNGGQQDDPVADPEIVAPSNRPSYTIHFAESPLLSEFWDDRVLEFPSADANVTLHGNPHPASGQVRFVERQVIANYHKEDTKSIRADLKPLASYPPAHAIDLHDKIHCLSLLPVHPSKRGIRPAKTGQQGNVSRSEDAQRASKNSVPSSNIQSPDIDFGSRRNISS